MSKRTRGQLALQQLQQNKKKQHQQIDLIAAEIQSHCLNLGISDEKKLKLHDLNAVVPVTTAKSGDEVDTANNASYSKLVHAMKRANNKSKSASVPNETTIISNSLITIDPTEDQKDDLHEMVLKISESFKLLDNVLFSLRKRKKKLSWDEIAASYNAIGTYNLSLDDLQRILSIWPEAYDVKWVSKTHKRNSLPSYRSCDGNFQGDYDLMIDIPSARVEDGLTSSEMQAKGGSLTDVAGRMNVFR